MTVPLVELVSYLDTLLSVPDTPDYAQALNGLQLENRGPIHAIAAAVDFSMRSIEGAAAAGANLLLVHHGMFWSGAQPIRDVTYRRLRALFDTDLAVYSAHLPIDRHASLGNAAQLAAALDLTVAGEFARFATIRVGVHGTSDVPTAGLVERLRVFAHGYGGDARASAFPDGRRTRRWAICTGAGASVETLGEARSLGIDTLIVGEGPHWTAVEAEQTGLVIIFAGHYATETLGVRAVAEQLSRRFSIPWSFVDAPTGL
jgi:dinuclear metal center YbgI/SA1388 family protein